MLIQDIKEIKILILIHYGLTIATIFFYCILTYFSVQDPNLLKYNFYLFTLFSAVWVSSAGVGDLVIKML